MGGGTWTRTSFCTYSTSVGRSVDTSTGEVSGSYTAQQMFKSVKLDSMLDPKNVLRECCDSDEHPNTVPVILALDVTGSMGTAAVDVAKNLSPIMESIFDKVSDVEFMIMGIGDVECDESPIQASQFESDIRIASQLDRLYFEFGGGGNAYESYTAPWYFGIHNTKLDCWNRGKKGIIITMGDELLNPVLAVNRGLNESLGCTEQSNVETSELYPEVAEKFDVYHITVDHGNRNKDSLERIKKSFVKYLGQNYRECTINELKDTIVDIIVNNDNVSNSNNTTENKVEYISW